MQINSINANLTGDDIEKARRFDARASDLEFVSAGGALIVLARGERAVDVFNAVRPLLGETEKLTPVAIEDAPPPRKVVPVTTGLRSAGGS